MHEPHHPQQRRQPRWTAAAAGIAAIGMLLLSSCSSGHPRATPTSTTQIKASDSTTPSATSTTVMGPSGSPADYPAAQPTPPSLAGAYPTGKTVNLVTVIKTLTTYEDWVWSHPNPALVANYELKNGNAYAGELKAITQFQEQGLHADPTPTEIDFVKVETPAKPQSPMAGGRPAELNGYQWFLGAVITVIENNKSVAMLKADGAASGQQFNPVHLGPTAYSISLVQGPDGQFRIEDSSQLNPPGGATSLEQGQ